MTFIPRNPWRPQRAGKRDKADGKLRCIINASYPESCMSPFAKRLADDRGGLVFSLNSRSRLSYDEARGERLGSHGAFHLTRAFDSWIPAT